MIYPSFEEYPHRKAESDIVPFYASGRDYRYTADELMAFFGEKDIEMLVLINPDNPSGNYIEKKDVLRIADWAKEKGILFVVDESFVDFAKTAESSTLLERDLLKAYPNLIVVKSISKSFGVPGLRLGVLASGDTARIAAMKKDESALAQFKEVRDEYTTSLASVQNLRVIPSQANYVMCELTGDITSTALAETLLDKYNILIKDLSQKKGFNGKSYIRLAVKTPQENELLVSALKEIL